MRVSRDIFQGFCELAVGEKSWTTILDNLIADLGIAGAVIVPLQGQMSDLPASTEFSDALKVYQKEGWYRNDVRFRGIPAMERRGVGIDLDFISERAIDREPYYQEWLKPFGLRHFAGVKIEGVEEKWVLSLQRQISKGSFQEEDFDALKHLGDGLSEAANMLSILGGIKTASLLEAFTASKKSAFILNRFGNVVGMTARAEQLLLTGRLVLRQQRLSCVSSQSNIELQNAIIEVCYTGCCGPKRVKLDRPDEISMFATVAPTQFGLNNIFASCRAYVIVSDPSQELRIDTNMIAHMLGLTRAEASVCAALYSGCDLRETANGLRISYETARSHLKSVFQKTGISSQPVLLATLTRLEL